MQTSQSSTPAADILRLTLSSTGVVVCLIACSWVWQMLNGQQALWPLPALYLLELSVVSIVCWLAMNRHGSRATPWVTMLPWAAIGIFVAFVGMGAMSIGFLFLPVALLFVLAALLADHHLATEGLDQRVQFVVADARNLAAVKEQHFDAVLLMGPLYHLIEETDRKLALTQAIDRLRIGGVICSSFLNRFGILGDLIKRSPQWIEDQAHVRSFLTHGRRPDGYPRAGFRGYSATPAEIAPLHEAMGLQTLVLAAVEPVIAGDDESYNRLQGEQRRLWLDLLFQISAQASTLGASRHLLYIGKKHKA